MMYGPHVFAAKLFAWNEYHCQICYWQICGDIQLISSWFWAIILDAVTLIVTGVIIIANK